MLGIAPVSRVSSARRALPAPATRSTYRDGSSPAVEAADPLSGPHAPTQGAYAPFLAQHLANDNVSPVARIAANDGAIAYLFARDRIDDLPVGFLISKSA
ncbi:MAG: hypothetical protein P4L82_02580 [Ancalomicrobiaceae bacterium]|nr:hypothetical protein [Ancalomicrobiaceae bacterium]